MKYHPYTDAGELAEVAMKVDRLHFAINGISRDAQKCAERGLADRVTVTIDPWLVGTTLGIPHEVILSCLSSELAVAEHRMNELIAKMSKA